MSLDTVELTHELGQNFIDYAMAVNTDRSIPDARTGLKPVHKRILYSAYVDGNLSSKKYTKCANNVGSMLASWHPHGDASVYDALVRLAQPWVMRYPLIDFHGNMGSQGGSGPAAYRYTECRLAKISEDGMLTGIKKRCVEFGPNFDDTKEEPKTLPSIFPNLLCNPNSGIGVAMACSWAPHNLKEVANAIFQYLENEEPYLPGPDFPTGATIINKDDIPKIMSTGRGSVKIRSKYTIEKNNIIFTEIPYGVTIMGIMDELKELVDSDKLAGISEIRNETNKSGPRIVVECAKGADIATIINILFQSSSLQSSFSYNQIALVDGEPKLLNLKQCIEIYIKHNLDCIVRESKFDLAKAKDRLEIVEGLLIALEDIDNVIHIIKTSDNPKTALMEKYNLSDIQVKSILDMKLAKLAKVEKIQLEQEKKELVGRIDELTNIITTESLQIEILRARLTDLVKKYGDERRTELAQIAIQKKEREKVVPEPKNCVVVITKTGLIKRVDKKNFKVQKRNTTGVKTQGDILSGTYSTNTQDTLMVFSSKGKLYRLLVDTIPEGTNLSAGVPLSNLIKFEDNEVPLVYTTLNRDTTKKFIFFATKNGIVKKVPLEEYDKVKRTGVITITLKDGDSLADTTFIDNDEMLLVTKQGMVIHFKTDSMPISSRIAQGVKGISLNDNDYVIAALPISASANFLALVTINNNGKKIPIEEFVVQNRGGKGLSCSREDLAGAVLANDDTNILVTGNSSSIVISMKDMPVFSRTAIGDKIVKGQDTINVISKV